MCIIIIIIIIIFPVARSPDSGSWPSLKGLQDHTELDITRGTTPSRRVISQKQTPLTTNNTQLTREKHPCIRRESNPQFQKENGRRPTPQTAPTMCYVYSCTK